MVHRERTVICILSFVARKDHFLGVNHTQQWQYDYITNRCVTVILVLEAKELVWYFLSKIITEVQG